MHSLILCSIWANDLLKHKNCATKKHAPRDVFYLLKRKISFIEKNVEEWGKLAAKIEEVQYTTAFPWNFGISIVLLSRT